MPSACVTRSGWWSRITSFETATRPASLHLIPSRRSSGVAMYRVRSRSASNLVDSSASCDTICSNVVGSLSQVFRELKGTNRIGELGMRYINL